MSKKTQKAAEATASASSSQPGSGDPPRSAQTRSAAPFALTSDGVVLINVDALPSLDAANLEGRVLFVGAGLAENENRLVYELLDNAAAEAHARVARSLIKRTEPEPEPE